LNTDELVAKRANLLRIKEFDRQLRKHNTDGTKVVDGCYSPIDAEAERLENLKVLAQESSTAKAKRFAEENLTKMRMKIQRESEQKKINGSNTNKTAFDNNNNNNGSDSGRSKGTSSLYNNNRLLQELENKYLHARAQVDLIR
jgi:hypothetical protein